MNRSGSSHIPLILALGVAAAATLLSLRDSFSHNEGHFSYPLDDSFIHMAMGKNLARHGVWGITGNEFSSSSSSPLWTSLVAGAYLVFGVNDHAPLILALLSAGLLLIVIDRLLRSRGVNGFGRFATLTAILFLLPVLPLVRTGMEHLLHGAISILFAWEAARLMAGRPESPGTGWRLGDGRGRLLMLAPLLATIRYEGLFEVAVVILFFAVQGRFRLAGMTGLAAGVVPAIYGIVSLTKGSYPVPNSLLLKANLTGFGGGGESLMALGVGAFDTMMKFPHVNYLFLLVVVASMFGYYGRDRRLDNQAVNFGLLLIPTFILHLQFARIGWFYRYEAYLIGWGIAAIAAMINEIIKGEFKVKADVRSFAYGALTLSLVGMASYHLSLRGIDSHKKTRLASTNIYEQQVQMGLFIKKYHQGEAVMLNDIGAPSYFADFRCIDKEGLGSIEALREIRAKRFTPESLKELAVREGVKAAILYRSWLIRNPGIPAGWKSIGNWTIQNNVICSSRTVDFYAVDPNEEERLRENFRAFAAELPPGVRVRELKTARMQDK